MRPIRHLPVADVSSAIAALGSDAALVAGGTNVVDLLRMDVMTPATLVDVNAVPLAKIESLTSGGLRIGALVRNSDLAWNETVRAQYPVLSQALLSGASPQIRNMATTAGNLMQRPRCWYFRDVASPCNRREPGTGCSAQSGNNRIHAVLGGSEHCIAVNPSDMNVAMAALDAVVVLAGRKGERRVPFVDFHRLPGSTPHLETALEAGEMITAVELPAAAWTARSHYLKVRDRAAFAFALVSVAAALEVQSGTISAARVALGGVAPKPWRSKEAEAALVGKPANDATFRAAAEAAMAGAKPYAHNAFKVDLARRAITRALAEVKS